MTQKILFLFVFFSIFQGKAQFSSTDTLKGNYAIGGTLDTLDLNSQGFSYPYFFYLNNSSRSLPFQLLNPTFRFSNSIGQKEFDMTFCALPHIGFSYLFGQQGAQQIRAEYQQKIAPKCLLNGSVDNVQFSGFQRNSSFQNLNYKALIKFEDTLVRSTFLLKSRNRFNQWNGGLENDSLLDILPQDFISVNKNDAQSRTKTLELGHQTFFTIKKDKSIHTFFGIENTFSRQQFDYQETGDIASLYNVVFIDSLQTADSLKRYRSANSMCLGLANDKSTFQVGVRHSYLLARAEENNLDTNTIESFLKAKWRFGKFKLESNSEMALFGNFNAWKSHNQLRYDHGRWMGTMSATIAQLPLGFNQRFYYGNTVQYVQSSSALQNEISFAIQAAYLMKKWSLKGRAELLDLDALYQFNGQFWDNSSMEEFSAQRLHLAVSYHPKEISMQAQYNFTLQNASLQYLPTHDVFVRISFPWGLFKDKVLKSIWGIDFHYLSAHQRFSFLPVPATLDVLQMSMNSKQPGFYKLSAFANFNVNHFRFFARWDNIPYFWVNPRVEMVSGIFYPQSQIKIGITWDFWN